MKKYIYLLILCQLSFGQDLCGQERTEIVQSSQHTKAISKARVYVDSLRKVLDIPGLSVTVSVKDEIVWSEGFGYADLESKKPVSINTKFRVGSVSKTMTAIALGKLLDQNLISLDEDVRTYVAEFPKKKYDFTVKELATHQAGISHYQMKDFLGKEDHYESVIKSLEVFADRKLKFEPGTDFQYSSFGYVLLSAVIKNASGIPYLEFMQKEVFEPLGASNTVPEDVSKSISNKSTFYSPKGKKVKEIDNSYKWAGGGYLSTSADLVRIADGMHSLLSPKTVTLLTTPIPLSNGEMNPQFYGIGWRIYESEKSDFKIIHHGGTSLGGRAFLAMITNEDITIAITANSKADFNLQEVYDIGKMFK